MGRKQVKGYLPVPMALRVLVKRSEHDRENGFYIIADEVAEVFVVPEIESALSNLVSNEDQEIRT